MFLTQTQADNDKIYDPSKGKVSTVYLKCGPVFPLPIIVDQEYTLVDSVKLVDLDEALAVDRNSGKEFVVKLKDHLGITTTCGLAMLHIRKTRKVVAL